MQQFSRHAAANEAVILLGNPGFRSTVLQYSEQCGLR
jgi:hypothetical protein